MQCQFLDLIDKCWMMMYLQRNGDIGLGNDLGIMLPSAVEDTC
jgi:hypothetical protein